MRIAFQNFSISPIDPSNLQPVLVIYQQCEDFLALGSKPTASLAMVRQDLEISRDEGGIFCGVYDQTGNAIGVIDFVASGFKGNPKHAFFSLLMLAAPHRKKGLGAKIVTSVEQEIIKNNQVKAILTAVQVNNPAALKFWQKQGYRIFRGPELQPDTTTVFYLKKNF